MVRQKPVYSTLRRCNFDNFWSRNAPQKLYMKHNRFENSENVNSHIYSLISSEENENERLDIGGGSRDVE